MVLEGSDTDDDEDAEIIQFQVGVLDPTPAKNHAWLCFPEKKCQLAMVISLWEKILGF